jgi:hypothetical protein
MKIIHVCLFALSLTLLMVACKREAAVIADTNTSNPLDKPSLGDQVKPLDISLIEPKVRAFQALLAESKSGTGTRSVTTIQAQELVDNIEMTLNYLHANAAQTRTDMIHKKDSFRLTNVNGLVDATNIYDVYKEVNNFVYDQYNAVYAIDKELFAVDVDVKNTNNGDTWVEVDTYTAKGLGGSTSVYAFYNSWTWATWLIWPGGTCDGSTPLVASSDAAQELQYAINRRYLGTQRYLYTDLSTVNFYNPERTPNDVLDNVKDYLLFQSDPDLPNYSECISPLDMSWYYSNLYNIITINKPAGKEFALCSIVPNAYYNQFGNPVIFHGRRITYGTIYLCATCTPVPMRRIQ